MHALIPKTHSPDPKCCCCGLKPRAKGNDVLRLVIIVLLLLPVVLMFLSWAT